MGSEEEAEPDWVQFQSFALVHIVPFRVGVECFLDYPLETVTFANDHVHIVETKGMLFEDRMLSNSRHVKSSTFDVGGVLLDAYTGCVSRFSNVCLFTVATLETKHNTWVILSTSPIFQLLLDRPLLVSWLSNNSFIQRPQDSLQGLASPSLNGTSTVVCCRWSSTSTPRDFTDSPVFRCLIRVRRLSMKRAE